MTTQSDRIKQSAIPSWLIVITLVLVVGVGLRLVSAKTALTDLTTWLPWLNKPTVTLYFMDAEARYFIPISRTVSASDNLAQASLMALIDGPTETTTLQPTLPPQTHLNQFEIKDGVAHVDISLPDQTPTELNQAYQAIEKTLVAHPEIQQVVVTLDGQPISLNDDQTEPNLAQLYFILGDYLVPVDASDSSANTPQQAIEAYLQGPPEARLQGLPTDTKLLEYRFTPDNGLVYLNLTYTQAIRELAVADPQTMTNILKAIIATLTEFPEVQAVILDFEGQTQLGLGQCRGLLRTPQLRPPVLNDERLTE